MRKLASLASRGSFKPDLREQRLRRLVSFNQPGSFGPEVLARHHRLSRDAHVLVRRELREYVRNLERFGNPRMDETVLRQSGDVLALEKDLPFGWHERA